MIQEGWDGEMADLYRTEHSLMIPTIALEVVLVASSCVVALCAYRISGWRALRNLGSKTALGTARSEAEHMTLMVTFGVLKIDMASSILVGLQLHAVVDGHLWSKGPGCDGDVPFFVSNSYFIIGAFALDVVGRLASVFWIRNEKMCVLRLFHHPLSLAWVGILISIAGHVWWHPCFARTHLQDFLGNHTPPDHSRILSEHPLPHHSSPDKERMALRYHLLVDQQQIRACIHTDLCVHAARDALVH